MSKKFLNEKINFLFIGQGQVDTWHYLRDLPEASSLRNLEFSNKIVILHNHAKLLDLVRNDYFITKL